MTRSDDHAAGRGFANGVARLLEAYGNLVSHVLCKRPQEGKRSLGVLLLEPRLEIPAYLAIPKPQLLSPGAKIRRGANGYLMAHAKKPHSDSEERLYISARTKCRQDDVHLLPFHPQFVNSLSLFDKLWPRQTVGTRIAHPSLRLIVPEAQHSLSPFDKLWGARELEKTRS